MLTRPRRVPVADASARRPPLAARGLVQNLCQRRDRRRLPRSGEARQLHGHDVQVVPHLSRCALLQLNLDRRRFDVLHADVPQNRLEVLRQVVLLLLPALHVSGTSRAAV